MKFTERRFKKKENILGLEGALRTTEFHWYVIFHSFLYKYIDLNFFLFFNSCVL
jgi:hypothetical protein